MIFFTCAKLTIDHKPGSNEDANRCRDLQPQCQTGRRLFLFHTDTLVDLPKDLRLHLRVDLLHIVTRILTLVRFEEFIEYPDLLRRGLAVEVTAQQIPEL